MGARAGQGRAGRGVGGLLIHRWVVGLSRWASEWATQ